MSTNMSRESIRAALGKCSHTGSCAAVPDCDKCPIHNNTECWQTLMQAAAEMLDRDERKIKELEAEARAKLEPRTLDLDDTQKEWLDDMTAAERLELIRSICVDWDGYRTATKLGDLINEIWTYAGYPVRKGAGA